MNLMIFLKAKAKCATRKAVLVVQAVFTLFSFAYAQAPNISYGTIPAFYLNKTITTLTPTNSGTAISVNGQTAAFAGTTCGYSDGTGSAVKFSNPIGIVCDPAGNVFVADAANYCIRKITPDGVVSTYAGIVGTTGAVNGPALSATFNGLEGMCQDAMGNLYIADLGNHMIRKITPDGIVSTFAGNGTPGNVDGPALSAEFQYPIGITADASGNIYVSDHGKNVIRKISSSGIVSTVAGQAGVSGHADGTGSAATFNEPNGICIDRAGNLIVCDSQNNLIRSITPLGTVTTIAGAATGSVYYADGTGTAARFQFPTAITIDPAGNLYVLDSYNNCIRVISPSMAVTTLAGTTTQGNNNAMGNVATFWDPVGLASDKLGNLYVSDLGNCVIRRTVYTAYSIDKPLPAGLAFNTTTGAISGTPQAVMATTVYHVTAYGSTSNSTTSLSLTVNASALSLSNLNYITSYSPRVSGITTNSALGTSSGDASQVETTVTYFDGLGRPIQSVQVKASPLGNDVVQPMTYDQFGRETVKYLPYAATTNNGSYKNDALTSGAGVAYFYNPTGSGTSGNQQSNGIVIDPNPYSQIVFENSPLNRPVEQGAPGTPWQPVANSTTGRTVKIIYTTNNTLPWTGTGADTVNSTLAVLYSTTINSDQSQSLAVAGSYAAGQLYVTVSKNENWTSGRGGTVEEYKDKEGHVVLKRQYNYSGTLQVLSTYYVYDNLGNLAFVLPPGAGGDAGTAISQTTLDNLCYQYRYDNRNRLVQKKIPGKGWEFTVYNTLDQAVMTQDANQRNQSPQQWMFTKYDPQGRVILTGLYTYSGSTADNSITAPSLSELTALQNTYNTTTNPKWENRNSSNATGYDELSDPIGHSFTYYTTSYYDNYLGIPGLPANYTLTAGVSIMTTGLPLVKKTAVLNTPTDQLWDVMYYDDLGRISKTYSQHYLGGTVNIGNYDLSSTTYNFINQPIIATRQHFNTGSSTVPQLTAINTYIYDQVGRKIKTWEQLQYGNNTMTPPVLISQVDYNEIGQVLSKHLHSTDGINFMQNIAYTYNERGWLLTSTAPLFALRLYYNTGSLKAFNGNIMFQYWGTPGSLNTYYSYRYDVLNRLTSGSSNIGNHENMGYDVMGNLAWLTRYQNGSQIDAFTPYYKVNGNTTNQLQTMTDGSGSNVGLANGTTYYYYDANGNVLTQTNSSNIVGNKAYTAYNLLNQPQSLVVVTSSSSSSTISYTYDAGGNKLRRLSTGLHNKTDYISGIQYDGWDTSTLTFIQTEEGKAVYQQSTGGFDYTYYLGDNLGNTRATFDTQNNTIGILQKDDYYPFGMEISTQTASPKNEYLYNKKELQEELQQYDYGARFYDPVIARWTSVDPLSEKSRRWSPYNYVMNNPVKLTDPDGMTPPTDYYGINGNYIGTDGVDDGKSKMALTKSTENAIRGSIAKGVVTANPALFNDLINTPTDEEVATFDNRFSTMEANNMTEQSFAVGYDNSGSQNIKTVDGSSYGNSNTTEADRLVRQSGGIVDYDGHTHGAVVKWDSKSQGLIIGGNTSSSVDRQRGTASQPGVVLGYDVQNHQGNIQESDATNAQNHVDTWVPLSNPGSFNKTISFYKNGGDITTIKYDTFKYNVSKVNQDQAARHLPIVN